LVSTQPKSDAAGDAEQRLRESDCVLAHQAVGLIAAFIFQ
jgi:hypothetical protein